MSSVKMISAISPAHLFYTASSNEAVPFLKSNLRTLSAEATHIIYTSVTTKRTIRHRKKKTKRRVRKTKA
jgi:hypothetical protein